jgi:ABC-type phosphate transport system substrate-binding protein
MRWSQVRPGWPDRPLKLFAPGRDSGAYDYFGEAILGKGVQSRTDYVASEDDNDLVKGVSEDADALGYFGFAYYQANQGKLKALGIDNSQGAVLPSTRETCTSFVPDGSTEGSSLALATMGRSTLFSSVVGERPTMRPIWNIVCWVTCKGCQRR